MNAETTKCPKCNSSKTEFDRAYGFHKCLDCLNVWGYAKDDPDYDDLDNLDDLVEEPIA
jgi:hypothetical protein